MAIYQIKDFHKWVKKNKIAKEKLLDTGDILKLENEP